MKRVVALMAGLSLLMAAFATPALAQVPPLPHAFFGMVEINGRPAPIGTQVEARGTGVKTGIEHNPITVTEAGKYGGPGALDPKLVVQGDIADGATLTFFVNGVSTGQTHSFASGNVTQLNLSVTIPVEPPPRAPAPAVEYNLTISSTAGGSVTRPGEGIFTYRSGRVVDLGAQADEGYRFVRWTGDVGTIANVTAAFTTITMIGDYEITANFIAQYDLTIDSTAGGSVTTPGEGTFTYDPGRVVTLTATAEEGYRFVNWTGDVGTIANVNAAFTTITMNGDYSIRANFAVAYDLTISTTLGGSVTTPGLGTFTYDEGAVVSLVAVAEQGYRFVNWTGDVGTLADVNAATTTITMNGDYSIRANFEEAPRPLNWPLIGGIIAAVVVAGLVTFFLLRRRRMAA